MNPVKSLTLAACIGVLALSATATTFVFVDEAEIGKSRTQLHSEAATAEMKLSYRHVLEEAALALEAGPFSVTDKTMVPPSKDMHDYLSLSPYWWPDESKPDGLPWIRKDGKTNPVSKTPDTDSRRIGHFTRSVRVLAIAYYFSGDEKYAERAIEYLRVWFLNPETRMNPNLNFAQGVPGIAPGRRSGLIDSRSLADRLLDAMAMLSKSPSWTEADEAGIRAWYSEYLDWLLTDRAPYGRSHLPQQPRELARSAGCRSRLLCREKQTSLRRWLRKERCVWTPSLRPMAPSLSNWPAPVPTITATSTSMPSPGLAQLGTKVDVDLWGYTSPKGASLKTAIEKMAEYRDPDAEWPWPHKGSRPWSG